MADRSIKVTLRADATQAIQEAKKLAASLTDVSDQAQISVGRAGKAWEIGGKEQAAAAQKAASEQKKSAAESAAAQEKAAQKTKDAWNTTGTALLAVGGAWTAFNVMVAKTGIEYNTLQQTSRAALKTILGDSQAVNAQMDKLDAFARTSPFSKATFITAQQQMLAFGIEAEKVVPYLSAINDATAAAGGNNQTLSELAFIMAQIGAAGKITGQDLMQFGQRGVNAAELIGSQMDMTGAQIRAAITDGTLDADAALDALAAGMSQKFEGASANVKETMGGAFDRVSAAFRDLSADLMSGAVSPDGGGWLVDLTNQAADFLRAIEKLPGPVKDTLGMLSGMGGAATLAAGGFILMAPRVVETVAAVRTLAPALRAATLAAGPWVLAIGVVGGLAAIVAQQHEDAARAAEGYAQALALGGEAAEEGIRQNAAQELALTGTADALKELGLAASLATDAATGNSGARQQIIDAYDAEIAKLRELADAEFQAGNLSEDYTNQAEQQALKRDQVISRIDEQAKALGRSKEQQAEYNALLGEGEDAASGYGAALDQANPNTVTQATLDAAAALGLLSDRLLEANDSLRAYADFQLMLEGSVDGLEAAYDKATDAIEKNGKTLDNTTEAGRANRQSLRDIAAASDAVTQKMVENGDGAQDVAAHIDEARDKYVAFAKGMGDTRDETELMREAMERIPSNIETTFFLPGMLESQEEMHELNALIQSIPPEKRAEIITIGILDGAEAAKRAINEVQGKTVTISINAVVGGRGAPLLGRTMYQADGGVVDYYADGGLRENHVAQIAPAGSWRVWAEPETGGEAYIPLAPAKRSRSLDIWQETGRRLGVEGFTDGGIRSLAPTYQPSFAGAGVGGGEVHVHHHYGRDSITVQGIKTITQLERALERSDERAQQRGVRRG